MPMAFTASATGAIPKGDLVILDQNGNETFVSISKFRHGWHQTGRRVYEVPKLTFKLARSNMWTASFETAAAILCAEEKAARRCSLETEGWGDKNPLVLDLNGDGIKRFLVRRPPGVSFDIKHNNGFGLQPVFSNRDIGFVSHWPEQAEVKDRYVHFTRYGHMHGKSCQRLAGCHCARQAEPKAGVDKKLGGALSKRLKRTRWTRAFLFDPCHARSDPDADRGQDS